MKTPPGFDWQHLTWTSPVSHCFLKLLPAPAVSGSTEPAERAQTILVFVRCFVMKNKTSLPGWLKTVGGVWGVYQLAITGFWLTGVIAIDSLWFFAGYLGMAATFFLIVYYQRKANQIA